MGYILGKEKLTILQEIFFHLDFLWILFLALVMHQDTKSI